MKNHKGSVGIENNNGRLRLRLPRQLFRGKQHYLYLGLSDTKANRKVASAKAGLIEADIIFERFDPSLQKYKSPSHRKVEISALTLTEIWAQYSEFKSQFLSASSVRDFKKIANHINNFPTQSLDQRRLILHYCRENLTADTTRRVITQLNACCEWAAKEGLISNNPFEGQNKWIKGALPRTIHPFTVAERDMILRGFEAARHKHYYPLVRFFFMTGCRTSEAVGLTWGHVSDEYITFDEAVVEGHRKQTKTGKSRVFPINKILKELLIEIGQATPLNLDKGTSQPVFTDTAGNLIRPNNFLRRHWQPVVKSLDIPYRPQYNTRHTFITFCLESGVPVAQVAAWVGNSPRVIWEHYAGFLPSEVPEF